MTAHPKDGGPVNPVHDMQSARPETTAQMIAMARGISLRDQFAVNALPTVYADVCREMERHGCPGPDWRDGVAAGCYAMADAMLKAREVGL
jgi:hypothetical protein